MVPKQPPKRTATRPGLGIEDALPRLESAELQKVRDSFEKDVKSDRDSQPDGVLTPPPQSRARVPREDDDGSLDSTPRSDRFPTANRDSSPAKRNSSPADREIPSSPVPGSRGSPVPRAHTALGLGAKTHPSDTTRRAESTPAAESPASRPPSISKPPAISRPPSSKPARWQDEAPSGQRSRKPLTVETVGDAATRIARGTRPAAPKIIASQSFIASAPIDSRSAFVLSLVDGTSDVAAIVDGTGMPEDEVIAILARLARLGLITVP